MKNRRLWKQKIKITRYKLQNLEILVSNRQWGNVGEDYSLMAIPGKLQVTMMPNLELIDGQKKVSGISDEDQLLCFAFSFGTKR